MKQVLIAVLLIAAVACEKVPLTAPTDSTITLTVDRVAVPIGGTATLTAVVVESSGTAPHNGTMVTFSAPFGTISPQEAPTRGGIATATFTATASGVAKVSAFSGGAKADDVEIKVGAAAAEKVTLRAEPATLSQTGGQATIIANVSDENGQPLPNAPVNFTTDNGSLSANSQTTNASGEARITLTTTRTAKVTAIVGGKTSEPLTITALAAPTVVISCGTAPVVGVAVTCTFTPAPGASSGTAITNVTVDWGDGSTLQSLGSVSSATPAAHVYSRADTYLVTGIATDTAGQTGRGTASVNVTRGIPTIAISASPTSAAVGASISFLVTPPTPSATTSPTVGVTVDFGDGTTRNLGAITAATTVTKTYSAAGTYTASATVTDNAGTRNTASTAVTITPPTAASATLTGGTLTSGCASFTVGGAASTGATISSITVVVLDTNRTIYSGTSGTTFAACGLTAGHIAEATVTDSAGQTAKASVVIR